MVFTIDVSAIANTRYSKQNAAAQNTLVHSDFFLQFLEVGCPIGFDINYIVSDRIFGMIDLLHNVEFVFCKDFCDGVEDTRLVFIDDSDSNVTGITFGKRSIGEVHRMANRTVF